MTKIKLCECGCGVPAPISKYTSRRNGWIKDHPKRFIYGYAKNSPNQKLNLIGQRFGKLQVLCEVPNTKPYPQILWRCVCDCGQQTTLSTGGLRSTKATNCGCSKRERMTGNKNPAFRHGLASKNLRSPEWRAFYNAKDRCSRPGNISYPYYGGRGIQFKYASIDTFVADVGTRPSSAHSLDRINNDGNYEPGNCKWSTGVEQVFNRRTKRLEQFSDIEILEEAKRRGFALVDTTA